MTDRRIDTLRATLNLHSQSHVLAFWDELDESSRNKLTNQLESINFDMLKKLANNDFADIKLPKSEELAAPTVIAEPKTETEIALYKEAEEIGLEAMSKGRVAVLVVAGGQGSRLGFEGPKGSYPIGPVTDRTLFQIHAEKILAASGRVGRPIPWYIMTSQTNDKTTREFLRDNSYFGLAPEDVFIFCQGMLPALDDEGNMFLAERDRIFTAPNGHGGTFAAMRDGGALADMLERNIEHIYYYQVDNPMLKIADAVFVGHHIKQEAQMSSKVLKKRSPDEPIGTLANYNGHSKIIEYSDLPGEIETAKTEDGENLYPWGSIAIHMISVDFAKQIADGSIEMPLHRASKKIPHLNSKSKKITPTEPNGTKFEMFIFDALEIAERTMAMECLREEEFAPVKNKTGKDSVISSRQGMTELYAKWLEASDVEIPRTENGEVDGMIEISPLTADSASALKKSLPDGCVFRDGMVI